MIATGHSTCTAYRHCYRPTNLVVAGAARGAEQENWGCRLEWGGLTKEKELDPGLEEEMEKKELAPGGTLL